MIRVKINGKEILEDENKFKTFGEIYSNFFFPGNILERVKINGEEIAVDKVGLLFEATVEGGEMIEIDFKESKKYIFELITDVLKNISQISEGYQKVIGKTLGECQFNDKNIDQIIDTLSTLDLLRENLFTLGYLPEKIPDDLKSLNSDCEEMYKTFFTKYNEKKFDLLKHLIIERFLVIIDLYKVLFQKVKEQL